MVANDARNKELARQFNEGDPKEWRKAAEESASTSNGLLNLRGWWAVSMPETNRHFFSGKAYGRFDNPLAVFREEAAARNWAARSYADDGGYIVEQI